MGSALLLVAGATAAFANAAPTPPDQAADGLAEAHTHGPDPMSLDRRGRPAAAGPYDVDAHVLWDSSQWDGAVHTADQPDITSLPTFHAIYLYPRDKASRFTQFAAMFQADARDTARLLGYGRAVRFDERINTGTRYLDITVVRSSNTAKKLGSGNQFSLVSNELTSRGFTNPNKKYVVWLDAPSQYCGQAQLYQDTRRTADNYNERRTTTIVYRPYPTTDASGGFCRGRTLLHELGHNMGALQRAAPHAFDGAHCNDSAEDVMCYTSQTSVDTGSPAFDWNNDDYWDPAANPALAGTERAQVTLSWWTVNLSRFVCPIAGAACGGENLAP
ncbi:MAG: zinc-dependent metalloprotease [Actinomycetota bacterium]|nr:zinc-dependent metalloprotease [Actinomycetota bacterium]